MKAAMAKPALGVHALRTKFGCGTQGFLQVEGQGREEGQGRRKGDAEGPVSASAHRDRTRTRPI